MFPLPVWIVPPSSQLEIGHLELKRPADTCVKCILPLPDGNNWSLEKVLTYCHLNGSERIPPAGELHCVSHRPTRTGQNRGPSSVNGTFVVELRIRLSIVSSERFRGNAILFLDNLRHTSALKLNAKQRGFFPSDFLFPHEDYFSHLYQLAMVNMLFCRRGFFAYICI